MGELSHTSSPWIELQFFLLEGERNGMDDCGNLVAAGRSARVAGQAVQQWCNRGHWRGNGSHARIGKRCCMVE